MEKSSEYETHDIKVHVLCMCVCVHVCVFVLISENGHTRVECVQSLISR